MEAMEGEKEILVTLTLFDDTDCANYSNGQSDASVIDTQSNDGAEPSTSGHSSSQSTGTTCAENRGKCYALETSNYEATLDPATRLAMLRKRKQRATAAARLDNTLTGFVDWVRDSDERKEAKMSARDQEDIMFQKEVINNLRVASTSLLRLTEYLTDTRSDYPVSKCPKTCKAKSHNGGSLCTSKRAKPPASVAVDDSDSEVERNQATYSDKTGTSDTDDECSVSLLSNSTKSPFRKKLLAAPQSTPTVRKGSNKPNLSSPNKANNISANDQFGDNQSSC